MAQKKIAIALVCSDWRLHCPNVDLNGRIIESLGVDATDLIVLPGPDGLCEEARRKEWDVAISQLKLLIGVHKACVLALIGHQDCAAHAVTDEAHEDDTLHVAREVLSASGFKGPMHAMLLIHHSDTAWGLKPLAVIS